MEQSELDRIADAYRRFAAEEARGRSALYETLAGEIADDTEILALLGALPAAKRQPNLLLAAVRHVAGAAPDWAAFRRTVLARWGEIEAVMLTRSTQTNEPGRCAVLLPVLARLPQPLALIEVGASGGLCLLPDRYAYTYGEHAVRAESTPSDAPVFSCRASRDTPLPTAVPRIVWRAGLDINPIDVGDAGQMAWLETLIWPEQADRLARFRTAARIAQADPPRVVRADLRDGMAALTDEAPKDATLVIFHTAVLAYVTEAPERTRFAVSVSSLCDYWISNESPGVWPDIAAHAPAGALPGRFLMAVNGAPVAWTDPHGAAMEWIGDPPEPHVRVRQPARG